MSSNEGKGAIDMPPCDPLTLLSFEFEAKKIVGEVRYRLLANIAARLVADDEPASAAQALLRERTGVVALCELTLLFDWFSSSDTSLKGLRTLTDMHEFRRTNPRFVSAFDLICREITEGRKVTVVDEDRASVPQAKNTRSSKRTEYCETDLWRKTDGKHPGACGGLSGDEDFTAKLYLLFSSYETLQKQESVRLLSRRIAHFEKSSEAFAKAIAPMANKLREMKS